MMRERPARFFLLAFAGVLVLALAERGIRANRTASSTPGRGSCWIWAAGAARAGEPVAFYAARDFELAAGSLAAAQSAALSIAADEGYELYVNGRPVGASSYRAGMAIDRYRVGGLLRAGNNRITVGLRSGRGAGGLIAALVAGGDRPLAVTDGDWRIFRRQEPELFDPDAPLAGGEVPRLWQRPPTGRWRLRPAEGDRPLALERQGRLRNRFPVRFRIFHPDVPWRKVRRRQASLPVRSPRVILDWGREVVGFLSFQLRSTDAAPALAYFGSEPPDPEGKPADALLIFAPGQRAWRDTHARRFRYALLIGVPPLGRVRVWELDPATAELFAPPPGEPAGVFGVRPPEGRSRAERQVWARLGR